MTMQDIHQFKKITCELDDIILTFSSDVFSAVLMLIRLKVETTIEGLVAILCQCLKGVMLCPRRQFDNQLAQT